MPAEGRIFIVMGVSGCGKSTLGRALAENLQLPFFDGDDFHPPENIQKMSRGIPLEDSDREQWLKRLNQIGIEHKGKGAVIACSALKEVYRRVLQKGIDEQVVWIYLYGTYQELLKRVNNRTSHFMPSALLRSQFDTLETPKYGTHIPVTLSVDKAVLRIQEDLGRQ
jgi:carbohydrate kinase (thermoresistant glucokinase family)